MSNIKNNQDFTFKNRKFRRLENIELDTDCSGHVLTQNDYIQIKVWLYGNEISNLVGTITFHLNMYDFEYRGIFNKSNSRQILDVWFYTGISNFVIKYNGNDWNLNFKFLPYFGYPEYSKRIKQVIQDYPEYQTLKI